MKLRLNTLLKSVVLLFVFAMMNTTADAQRTITGTVTDAENGDPLIGATIVVQGNNTGTITDFDGNYSLDVSGEGTVLEFSYTGYAAQTVTVGASNNVDMALSAGTILDEVVVIGYGTVKAGEVTSSVTSIKAEDFNGGNVNDPTQLIQGKVAGLSVSTPGGDPNGTGTIRLRGLSSFGQQTSPLIVIDGVIGASLDAVDPNDIASIDVLKDGSAAAIYGTRGSAGVILITTKTGKGSGQKSTIEYNGQLAVASIANQVPVATAAEFRQYRDAGVDRGSSTNWMDEVTQTGLSNIHNLSFSGGVGSTSYRASLNVRDVNGIGINTGFNQLNGRLNLSQKALNDKLTVGLNLSATQKEQQFGFAEAFRYASTYNPTAPVRVDESDANFVKYGGYYQEENFDYFNPVAIAEQGINNGTKRDILVGIRADYELIDGLKAGVFYSRQKESIGRDQFYPSNAFFRGFNTSGVVNKINQDRSQELFEITGNYERSIGNSDLDVLVGYSWQEQGLDQFSANGFNFISDDLTTDGVGFSLAQILGRPNQVTGNRNSNRIIGMFGRVNYNIDNTYFLMASVRREGSSRFGANNKWGIFPAFSAGVNLANLIDVAAVDNLKVRVGYGVTGANAGQDYLSLLRYGQAGNFFFNGAFVPAYGPITNANPDLKWETKTEINGGIDFALLDYKLTGSLDVYNRRTEDLLFTVEVPTGADGNVTNRTNANLSDVNLVSNGIELSIGYLVGENNDNFSWEPRVNFATYKTVLDSVGGEGKFKYFQSGGEIFDNLTSPGAPGQNDNPTVIVRANEEIGQIWGPVYTGTDDAGIWQFEDVNGDGTVNPTWNGDAAVIGNGLPDFSLGFANTFKFGNLDLNIFLRGDFGHDLANMYRNFYESLGNERTIENIVITEFFDENSAGNTPFFHSNFVEKASYLRLDNATLGYTFDLGDGGAFSKIRAYVSGQNLFTITNYSGVDPSPRYDDPGAADNGGRPGRVLNTNDPLSPIVPSPLAPGLDRRNTYFTARTFTVGLNLGF